MLLSTLLEICSLADKRGNLHNDMAKLIIEKIIIFDITYIIIYVMKKKSSKIFF